jgi:hypothetical protein
LSEIDSWSQTNFCHLNPLNHHLIGNRIRRIHSHNHQSMILKAGLSNLLKLPLLKAVAGCLVDFYPILVMSTWMAHLFLNVYLLSSINIKERKELLMA